MGILKTLTVSHKREANGNYSLLLTKTPAINQPCLVLEAGTVVSLCPEEADKVRRSGGYVKVLDGYACLGMLQYAYEGSKEVLFLLIVTGCVSVGKIQNSEIFCVTEVVPFSMRNGPDDQQLVVGLRRLLSSGSFYFSHSSMPNSVPYDLTLSAQRAHMTQTTDNRFFWNRLLHRHFERFSIDTSLWLVKALCGGINISTVYIGGLQAKACLISRLSCERAGTRFNVRGVNDMGHVANFVETEQVIFLNQTVLSYLIIRGSIPLFWEQPGVQVGSHRIKMSRGSEISQAAYDKHMFLLRERYDNVVIINLLSSRESELPLNQLFNLHHKTSRIGSEFPFINFDYHALCPRGHKENLEGLYQQELERYCDQFGYFHAEKGEMIQIQRGVLRTNCLDCLDRTNSMQTFLGLKILKNLVSSMEKIEVSKVLARLNDVYENIWVQNGDQISRIYTGTGALEGKNLLKDGTLSVARTIQNNLLDGSKQSAIDILILGRILNRDYSYRAASFLPHYFIYASPSILVSMCDKYLEYCTTEKLKVSVATWNVNGGRHFDNIMHNRARPISDWLLDYKSNVEGATGEADLLNDSSASDKPVDIYAIGFQEIVDLNASNIMASSTQNQRDWLVEIQRAISRDEHYLLMTSVQLVGVCLFVFIRAQLAPFIKDVCNDQVKTGLGGATGNKGGVAIRFRYKASSLCFVCAHFAAGQHQVKERNDDYAEITRKIQFPMGRSINSHDYVFWCGDFNYRLEGISNEEARRAAALGDHKLLLQYDQLKVSQAEGQTFKGYLEGEISFAPTYKYDVNSTDYDSSDKCRIPAYTDRILFKKRHATRHEEQLDDLNQIKFYNRIELMSSDHRPVVAELEIEVLEVDKSARNEVFEFVLEQNGPPDATVFVQVDGHLSVTDEQVFAYILKLLAEQAGEIVLVRYTKSSLMIIFSEGKAAVKALQLNGMPLAEHLPDNKLIVRLRTSNWHQVIHDELVNNIDNTTNLVTGNGPSVHLEDDEDEAAQELNMSIGPEVQPESICLNHELFLSPEPAKALEGSCSSTPEPAQEHQYKTPSGQQQLVAGLPPKSPLAAKPTSLRAGAPMRPPPPPPTYQQSTRQGSPALPPLASSQQESRIPVKQAPLPPLPGSTTSCSTPRKSSLEPDPFGWPPSAAAFSHEQDLELETTQSSSDFGTTFEAGDQTSVNLLEFSSTASVDLEPEELLPPPTSAPPLLPADSMTPGKLPPALPLHSPVAKPQLSRPSRAAPPPPIPERNPPPPLPSRPLDDSSDDLDGVII